MIKVCRTQRVHREGHAGRGSCLARVCCESHTSYRTHCTKIRRHSSRNVGFHRFQSFIHVCHALCLHFNHAATTHCEDSSNAKHIAFHTAKCYCHVQKFGYAHTSDEQYYHAFYCKDDVWHYHGNSRKVDSVPAYFVEDLKEKSKDSCSIENIYKASAMAVGDSSQLYTQKLAVLNPQKHFWNQVDTCDSAGEYASTGCLHGVIGVLQQLLEPPSIKDLICILQICKRNKDLKYGKHLHAHMCNFGLESHRIVGNHVVQMFAYCGCVSMAQQVLSRLMNYNMYTWTSFMSAFIQCGQAHQVINMYEKMQVLSVYHSKHMLVTILKACARLKDLDRGKQIFTWITQRGFEMDLFVGSTLIDMYAKCDLLLDAEEVFDKLPLQNTVSWSALIAAYAEHEYFQEALKCFERMQHEGFCPDEVTFVLVLKCCGILKARDKALDTHSGIIQKGLEKGLLVGNSVVDMYSKCGLLAEAGEVCSRLAVRDVVSWTALITGYSEHGFHEELLLCFDKMQLEGIVPDATTFASVLKACTSIGAIGKGREIHKKAEDRQLDREMFVCSTLVDMYAKCGLLSEAQEAFDKLPTRDVVSWNALIAGYAEHGPCKEVLSCFERMQLDGVAQGAVTFLCALKACGDSGAIHKGQELHSDCTLRAFDNDLSVGSTLVDMYAKLGLLSEAQDIFCKLEVQDVVSWNAIIKAHGINQVGGLAVHLFERMQKEGVKPDNVTFTCLLKACSRACLVQKGQQLFKMMTKDYGIATTRDHIVCMIDLFARSGHVEAAWKLLETMPSSPSDEMLRALLSACKTHAEQALGILCYEQLVQLNPECAAPYLLMSDIYQRQGKWELAYKLEELRKNARATKKPASALIEVNKKVHEFLVGEAQNEELSLFLGTLTLRVVTCGHIPDLEGILRLVPYGAGLYDFAP